MSVSSKKLLAGTGVSEPAPTDEYWNDVQLLMNGDKGSDGDDNTTFTGAAIVGSPVAANVNPYGAHYFDFVTGELDVIETASELTFGTGDFTIEFWVYFDLLTGNRFILDWRSVAGAATGKASLYTGNTTLYWYDGSVNVVGATVATAQWYHVAVARSGTTTRLFLNGAQVDSATDSTNYGSPADNLHIGQLNGTFDFDGRLSNLRIVKGAALYTGSFIPPTETLTDVTGTSLLTFVNGAIVDYSSEAHDITSPTGTISAHPGGPLNKPYDANAGSIVNPNDTTGATNYIHYPTAQTGMGTNFTIEFWYYPYTVSTSWSQNGIGNLLDADSLSGYTTEDWWMVTQTNADLAFWSSGSGSPVTIKTWSSVLKIDRWHHVMITGDGTNVEMFVNGVSQGTGSFTYGTGTGTRDLHIGYQTNANARYFRGLMSDVRLSDTVRETADFTPPAAPLTSDGNTTELFQFNEAACGDVTGKAVVTGAGDAQMDTAIFKYGTGALTFDGTGDELVIENNGQLNLSLTGTWTIELWARPTNVNGTLQSIVVTSSSSALNVQQHSTNRLRWKVNGAPSADITGPILSNNTWYHIAFVMDSGVAELFVDGVSYGTKASPTSFTSSGDWVAGSNGSGASPWSGNIDDLRVTNGVARYTANFTPPARAAETQQTPPDTGDRVVDISPAFGGQTSWNFDVDGDLDIGTHSATEYTITPQRSFFVDAKLWGGGGAGGWYYLSSAPASSYAPGGGGGAATGRLLLRKGTDYTLRIGEGGAALTGTSGPSASGATWVAGGVGSNFGPEGGGYSGILDGSTVVLMAGGGGGGADLSFGSYGGAGGGTTGQDAVSGQGGGGGTQSAGGAASSFNGATAGSYLTGGMGQNTQTNALSEGGGGGYYGGGGGNVGGGGGGSGHANSSYGDLSNTALYTGSGATPGKSTDTDRNSAGDAGTLGGAGTDGRIFLTLAS